MVHLPIIPNWPTHTFRLVIPRSFGDTLVNGFGALWRVFTHGETAHRHFVQVGLIAGWSFFVPFVVFGGFGLFWFGLLCFEFLCVIFRMRKGLNFTWCSEGWMEMTCDFARAQVKMGTWEIWCGSGRDVVLLLLIMDAQKTPPFWNHAYDTTNWMPWFLPIVKYRPQIQCGGTLEETEVKWFRSQLLHYVINKVAQPSSPSQMDPDLRTQQLPTNIFSAGTSA